MRLALCSLLLLVACTESDGDFPIHPNGGSGMFGSGSGTLPDAGSDGSGPTIAGRVCGLSEILVWKDCDPTGLAGLTVTIGGASAMTLADGTFFIATPAGANLAWEVTGTDRLPSLRELTVDFSIPSITTVAYEDITSEANVVIGNGLGTIFAQVMYMNSPVTGATATLPGLLDFVRYDDADASGDFGLDATHASGIVWFPNVSPGANVTFTVTPPLSVGEPTEVTVPVKANTATFATVVFEAPPPQ